MVFIGSLAMQPPGTEDSAFFAFAVLDELLRTLIDKGVLSKSDTVGLLNRTVASIKDSRRTQTTGFISLAEKMIGEYSK